MARPLSESAKAKHLLHGQRLHKLHDLIHSIPRDKYDHSKFITETNKCGTVACTLGHAVVSGAFPDIGIVAIRDEVYEFDLRPSWDAAKGEVSDQADFYFGNGIFNAVFEYDAFSDEIEKEFGQVRYLEMDQYITPARVCARIRKLAKKKFNYVIPEPVTA